MKYAGMREDAAPFLLPDDHSLEADIVRAAMEITLNVENSVYNPNHEATYRSLAHRLWGHGLAALQARTTQGDR